MHMTLFYFQSREREGEQGLTASQPFFSMHTDSHFAALSEGTHKMPVYVLVGGLEKSVHGSIQLDATGVAFVGALLRKTRRIVARTEKMPRSPRTGNIMAKTVERILGDVTLIPYDRAEIVVGRGIVCNVVSLRHTADALQTFPGGRP